jgi:hypothetical protein
MLTPFNLYQKGSTFCFCEDDNETSNVFSWRSESVSISHDSAPISYLLGKRRPTDL